MEKKLDIYDDALHSFIREDTENVKIKSGADYNGNRKVFTINYFGQECAVCSKTGKISTSEGHFDLSRDDKTLILQYMVQSSGLPPRGQWISFLELPGGPLHHVPLQNVAILPLVNTFGSKPNDFARAAKILGGREIKLGDCAFEIFALPKVPLAVVLWLGDEEFPAKGAILYDSSAENQLSTAALWVLGCRLSAIMINLGS